jgi:hypothetical protein
LSRGGIGSFACPLKRLSELRSLRSFRGLVNKPRIEVEELRVSSRSLKLQGKGD